MITKKQRKSSRSHSLNRNKKRNPNKAIFILGFDADKKVEQVPTNRAAFRTVAALSRNPSGLSTRQEMKQKRKDRQKASRQVLRTIRTETKKAMRNAA